MPTPSNSSERAFPESLHFSTQPEGWRHHEAREAWMLHTRRCEIGDEPGADFFCGACIALNDAMQIAMSADRERKRIVSIIQDNVPHDGHCSMHDCTGCQIIDELTRLIHAE